MTRIEALVDAVLDAVHDGGGSVVVHREDQSVLHHDDSFACPCNPQVVDAEHVARMALLDWLADHPAVRLP